MRDMNECLASMNVGVPDDVRRLKEAGYYKQALARIDAYLAEDWCESANHPKGQPLAPQNPAPHGVDAMRDSLMLQREVIKRLQGEYCWSEEQALARVQSMVRDFTDEEFRLLDEAGDMDWRFVDGEKRYMKRFAETLLYTHADIAARSKSPVGADSSLRRHMLHEKMEHYGIDSADITLKTNVGMSDEAFEKALAAAKADGRNSVHVRAWLPLPVLCSAQSNITLDSFTEQPTHIAAETAPQRTAYWEADLTQNRLFGAQYSYRSVAYYTNTAAYIGEPEQPAFDTQEQLPHIAFTPYLRALVQQLTAGITDPMEKARRIYDFITLNIKYHFQPRYFVLDSIADYCVRNRRGDCGVMAATFVTMCRLAGIPAQWQSGLSVTPQGAGCHDWATFYVAPRGWMYADCSFGASAARAGDEVLRQHYFGSLDTDRMIANNAMCAPFDPPMRSFRADPTDNQTGEIEVDGVGLYGDDVVSTQTVVCFKEKSIKERTSNRQI